MEQAMKERDEETRREMEDEMRKLQEHIERAGVDLATMTSRYDEEKRKTEDVIRRVQEWASQEIGQVRQEAQQALAANSQQMVQLHKLLDTVTSASAAERKVLQEQIDQLQSQRDSSGQNRIRGLVLHIAGSATAGAVLFAL